MWIALCGHFYDCAAAFPCTIKFSLPSLQKPKINQAFVFVLSSKVMHAYIIVHKEGEHGYKAKD